MSSSDNPVAFMMSAMLKPILPVNLAECKGRRFIIRRNIVRIGHLNIPCLWNESETLSSTHIPWMAS